MGRLSLLLLALLPSGLLGPRLVEEPPEPVRVFVFAGQSNMEGADSKVEHVDRFPPFVGLGERREDVRFSFVIGREDKARSDGWVPLAPVRGMVGPELSFARKVTERTGAPLAIIKVAAGGTHLGGDWNPDEPQGFEMYPLLVETVRASLADLDDEGVPWSLEGLVWHQGENDMFVDEYREAYGANLTRFLARLRVDLEAPDLRVFVGELCTKTVWGMDLRPLMGDIARGQRQAVAADPLAEYVPTSHVAVEVGDPVGLHYHYGTLGQLEHGVNHADAYLAHLGLGDEPSEPLERWPLKKTEPVQLWVLAGHRNMEGERSFAAELGDLEGGRRLAEADERIPYRYSLGGGGVTSNGWEALAPAGPYGTFGPELSFGAALAEETRASLAIAKFTHGGSQIIDWTPEGSEVPERDLYPDFLAFVQGAVAGLEGRGHRVELAGVVYHVGENDMSFRPYRAAAAERIGALVAKSREDLELPELRWFLSQQRPTAHESVDGVDVTSAIADLAAADEHCTHLKAFEPPPQAERLVLDTAGVVWLGRELARGVLGD